MKCTKPQSLYSSLQLHGGYIGMHYFACDIATFQQIPTVTVTKIAQIALIATNQLSYNWSKIPTQKYLYSIFQICRCLVLLLYVGTPCRSTQAEIFSKSKKSWPYYLHVYILVDWISVRFPNEASSPTDFVTFSDPIPQGKIQKPIPQGIGSESDPIPQPERIP